MIKPKSIDLAAIPEVQTRQIKASIDDLITEIITLRAEMEKNKLDINKNKSSIGGISKIING